ncbi:10988_t:CDS:2 [Acaulospora morrowiae]|uniref:10988_t:CDS:1 n=1 Tax=Acaulospora morrowiae TaxID=94023 RepID=A0A9N9CJY0_9GLOM|nr:10988_t:CDS:2 [Acaulospora morrowiae]
MPYNERTPLISTERANYQTRYYNPCCFLLCSIVVIIITGVISSNNNADFDLPTDISQIPLGYSFRLKNRWSTEYLVETLPVEFQDVLSNKEMNDDHGVMMIAKIVSKLWSKGIYQIQEFRYKPDGNVTMVSTVFSNYEEFWLDDVLISFTEKNNESLKPLDLRTCDYRIGWFWLSDGYISRKCSRANEEKFYKVAYFRRNSLDGLDFFSMNHTIEYGEVSKVDPWLDRRDVIVDQSAPYPPILPAICSIYYDSYENSKNGWNSIYNENESLNSRHGDDNQE